MIAAGYSLGSPLVVRASGGGRRPGHDPAAGHAVVAVSDPGFVVETVKAADDGRGVIVRGYEALGGRRRFRLSPGVPCRGAVRTDLLERDGAPVAVDGDGGIELTVRPFELVTLRLLA